MNDASDFEFDDLQALLRFGHGKLTDTCFMLLNIADAAAAGKWLATAPVSSAGAKSPTARHSPADCFFSGRAAGTGAQGIHYRGFFR